MPTPWKVAAKGDHIVPWFLVLPDDASVADLTRYEEIFHVPKLVILLPVRVTSCSHLAGG